MFLATLLVLLGAGVTVDSERHSLHYIYTALSSDVNKAGIHKFTAMGLLDNIVIDYFDSEKNVKIPKQEWMKVELKEDYWKKGTESRQSKQQWFKVNIEILMKRLNQSETDIHVLQWIHGCEAEMRPDGKLVFQKGIDMYSYDGNNFLYFDDANEVWVAPVTAAETTKNKWDGADMLKTYTKGYLENECMEWMNKFLGYQRENEKIPTPDVFINARNSKIEGNILLSCMATGFSSMHTVLRLKRNGRTLGKVDGMKSSGVRPNGDNTYQILDQVEILEGDDATYICEVIHDQSKLHLQKVWDGKLSEEFTSITIVVGALGALGGLVIIVGIIVGTVVFLKRRKTKTASSKGHIMNPANGPLLASAANSSSSSESHSLTSLETEQKA